MNGDERTASEQQSVDEHAGGAMSLDGNAAAGILSEFFVPDLTTARATCANGGATRELGTLFVYGHGMGTVMRCPRCDAVVLRVGRTRAQLWLDLTGAKLIVTAAATTALSTRGGHTRRSLNGFDWVQSAR